MAVGCWRLMSDGSRVKGQRSEWDSWARGPACRGACMLIPAYRLPHGTAFSTVQSTFLREMLRNLEPAARLIRLEAPTAFVSVRRLSLPGACVRPV